MNSRRKIVLITGAESGIGKSTCKIFHNNGYKVIGTCLKKPNIISKKIEYHQIDITNNSDWKNLASIIKKKYKKIDVLVNSAGVRLSGNLETTPLNEWTYHFNNNVTGTFLACKYALPLLKKGKQSSIVNLASINSIRGAKNMLAYATSKSALISFTASLALDLTKHNIRVNAVAPSLALNPHLSKTSSDELINTLINKEVLGRAAEPWEIANIILFLSSEQSSFMTGEVLSASSQRA